MSTASDIDVFATSAYRILSDYFDITTYRPSDTEVVFFGNPILRKRGWRRRLKHRLAGIQAHARITRDDDAYRIKVLKHEAKLSFPPLLNLILFALTFATVLISATIHQVGFTFISDFSLLAYGLPFTIALLGILLVHEMGHFIAGHRRGIVMSYPFFIPAPTFLGTFGALIKSRTPIRNRNDLIIVGAAGPLAGAIPAILALIIGMSQSEIGAVPPEALIWGDSLLTLGIKLLVHGPIPPGMDVIYSPIALAGHVGLLVTMINLLPLGQLDGGHILYGLFGKGQHRLAAFFLISLAVLGWFWNGWWIWLILAFLIKPLHPPVIDDHAPDRAHRIIGWLGIVLFLLCFTPIPIS